MRGSHTPRRLSLLRRRRVAGLALDDALLTHDELGALMAGLLVSHEPPRGVDRFDEWLVDRGDALGRRYTSELARNFR